MSNIIFKTILLKGEAGNDIQSVEKTATSGLVDTYTITLTDGSTYTFNVTNGKSIVSIEKTSSVGYVDTYTITYNDGTTDTFEITLATITVDDALSDRSTNPVENRVVTNALNTKSNNSNLATVESGTTASQAYVVGDYLVYNGQLCKVISAIAQGDTLTVGTNIEVTTSGGEFKKINSDLSTKIPEIVWANPAIQSGTTNSFIIANLFIVNMVYILSSNRPQGTICKFRLNGTDVDIAGRYFGYARNETTGDMYSIYTNSDSDYITSTEEMPAGTYDITLIAKVIE